MRRGRIAVVLLAALGASTAAAQGREAPGGDRAEWEGMLVLTPGVGDYPRDAQLSERSGAALLELDLDAGRRVTGCRLVRSSGHRDFDAASCPILLDRNYVLPPAEGESLPGVRRVIFRWPDSSDSRLYFGGALAVDVHDWFRPHHFPYAPLYYRVGGRVVVTYDISAEGRAENCRVLRSSGHESFDSASCWVIERRARFLTARDASGVPRPTRGRTQITFRISD